MKWKLSSVQQLCMKMETFQLKLLLLICFQTLCLAVPFREGNYYYRATSANGTTTICLSCPPGTYLTRNCTIPQTTGQCQLCPISYFQPNYSNSPACLVCATQCLHGDVRNRSETSQAICEPTKNYCPCKNSTCILDSKCPPGTEPAIQATNFQHTVCKECPEETYSDVYSSTEMCKPSTKCGPDEVAILSRDKTRDRVCMPRSGDFNNTWNWRTITPIVNNTTMAFESPNQQISVTGVIEVVGFASFGVSIVVIAIFLAIYKFKHRYKPVRKGKEHTEYLCSYNVNVDEKANKCSYNRQRNYTQSVSKNKEGFLPVNASTAVHTIEHIEDPSSHEEIEDSLDKLENSNLLTKDLSVTFSSLLKENSSTPFKLTEGTKSLDSPYNDSKTFRKTLDDPCLNPLELPRENTKDLPKTQDDPYGKVNASTKTYVPYEKKKALPKPSYEQTKVLPSLHLPQRKTILSTEWQHCELVTNQGCVLQLPDSDVITTFPPGFLSDGVSSHCYKTVHNDIPRIADALRLQDETIITSPVPEYYMQEAFAKFVKIQIPHRMPKNYKQIKVYSFSTHSEIVDLVEVKCLDDKSKTYDDIDMFCVINSESVVIYTKHFSGFVCTTCQIYIEYNLSASVYGRQGMMDGRTDTLDVLLYLKGAKASIADFRVTMEDKIDKRFHHLETKEVKLLEKHEQSEGGQLQFRFCLVSDSIGIWIHRQANDGEQLQYDLVLADPEKLMRECEKHIICSPNTKWYLQREDDTHKNCDFYVEIVHKEKPASAMNTLHLVKTYIPASENFEISGALAAASEQSDPIPGPITDVVLTLKDSLNPQDSIQLVRHLGCLRKIPPEPTRRQTEDFRFDYWYNAFLACYDHLKDQFINRVLDGLKKMGKARLESLICVYAPQNNNRIACVSPNRQAIQEGGGHITQPSSSKPRSSDES